MLTLRLRRVLCLNAALHAESAEKKLKITWLVKLGNTENIKISQKINKLTKAATSEYDNKKSE